MAKIWNVMVAPDMGSGHLGNSGEDEAKMQRGNGKETAASTRKTGKGLSARFVICVSCFDVQP